MLIRYFIILIIFFASISAAKDCHLIRKVEINDILNLSSLEIEYIKNKFNNKCINSEILEKAVKSLTNYLIAKGHISSYVFIPEQNISSSNLKIEIKSSKISKISFIENGKKIEEDNNFKNLLNQNLNLRNLEQHINNLNSAGNNSVFQLKPGAKDGETEVEIRNDFKKYSFLTGIIANYDKNSETYQNVNNLKINRIFAVDDSFTISTSSPINGDSSNLNIKTLYSIPWGYNKYYIFYESGNHKNTKTLYNNNLIFKGNNKQFGFKLSRLIYDEKKSKLDINFGCRRSEYVEKLNELTLSIQTHKLTVLEAGIKLSKKFKKSNLALTYTLTKGFFLDATKNQAIQGFPDSDFTKSNLDAEFSYNFLRNNLGYFIFNSNYSLQHSMSRLFSSEKVDISSSNAVRGLSPTKADIGFFGQNEILYIPAKLPNLQAFFGYNHGTAYIKNNDRFSNLSSSSISLGSRINFGYFSGSFVYSKLMKDKQNKSADSYFMNIFFNL